MPQFWLDANVFITAKNSAYGFDIVPGFWELLDHHAKGGIVCSSTMVLDELIGENAPEDTLCKWIKERKDSPLFSQPSDEDQKLMTGVADHVYKTYIVAQSSAFLKGADAWVIAHAKRVGGTVVTFERPVPANSSKAKIPNVCKAFEVPCIDPYELLRKLGASFVMKL